jgi:hypothetical protein
MRAASVNPGIKMVAIPKRMEAMPMITIIHHI